MIGLIIIGIGFTWLLIETDWMRVRLLVGSIKEAPVQNNERYVDWEKAFDFKAWGTLIKGADIDPICGWDWIKNRQHIIPECRIEMVHLGVRHTIVIKDVSVIKDVVKAMRAKPHNGNGHKKFSRNKLGGLVVPLPARVK